MTTLCLLQVEARCSLQAPAVGQVPIFLLFQQQACVGKWGSLLSMGPASGLIHLNASFERKSHSSIGWIRIYCIV